MTNKREVLDYLHDILDAAQAIEIFVHNMSYEEFARDRKTTYAVIRAFEILGEAAKNVPETTRIKFPKVPWRQMSGMRDKVIHEYFGVKLAIVWEAIERDIPALVPLISEVINTETQSEHDPD